MDIKIPALVTLVLTLLIIIINIIRGNPVSAVFVRALFSGVLIFGILMGIGFVFKNVLKIDFSDSQGPAAGGSEEHDGDDASDSQFSPTVDYVVNDEDGGTDDLDADVLGEEGGQMLDELGDEDDGLSGSSSIGGGGMSIGDESDIEEAEEVGEDVMGSYEDYNSDEEGSHTPTVNSDGDTIKEKLGFDASSEDLAKAVKTVLKRDGD